mmetsp:Transcript_3695/g.5572  ORF Transcript_3695/g.5572 Transcript_3695/m.5572 type:complete len:101 (+) Transcript_3695:1501-1803(+)
MFSPRRGGLTHKKGTLDEKEVAELLSIKQYEHHVQKSASAQFQFTALHKYGEMVSQASETSGVFKSQGSQCSTQDDRIKSSHIVKRILSPRASMGQESAI